MLGVEGVPVVSRNLERVDSGSAKIDQRSIIERLKRRHYAFTEKLEMGDTAVINGWIGHTCGIFQQIA